MNGYILALLIIIGIAIVIALVYTTIYNRIQSNTIRIHAAESEIDEALRNKYDILKSMETIINENTEVKINNFEELEKKNVKISNFDMDRKLTKISDTCNKISSDYTQDLDIDNFKELTLKLKINEEKIVASKTYYNQYTTRLNLLIKKFPSNIIARMHRINTRMYFDNKNMEDNDILDFKY